MKLLPIYLGFFVLCSPAYAGISYPPYTDSQAVVAAQQAGMVTQSVLPPVCSSVPNSDSLLGTIGSQPACTPPSDSSRPTAVQRANTTLDSNCNWTVTFQRAFTSSNPIIHANVILSGASSPIPCIVISRSTTVQSGKCFPAQTTALNLSVITAGLTLSPFSVICTNGTPVMVVGAEPTQ